MGSVTEPQIAALGGGVTQQMIDRLLGAQGLDAQPVLMRNTETKEFTYMGLPFQGDPHLFLKNDDPAYIV